MEWEENRFLKHDKDNKGYLGREGFKVAIAMLFGYKPSKTGMSKRLHYISHVYKLYEISDVLSLLLIIIGFYLKNRGFLTFEDFKKAFNSVSAKLSERIIVQAFREVDQDSDGHISFKGFESAMKYGQDEVSPVYFA
ncbi:PREDICTED: EF-hand calcium-binding domain-containing protein 11 [Calidris pugnax]|uniref:EF-hand calcium-binding domain-containing protein 11 n=1 Tax=Calidris pugnax TaxID=198806 RepID=UPI00071CDD9A|nr:PREDICTED: EF-hand calcium-binding domain-containing protein 11 [Calidris pugnax]